jgi:hypothetical protein
MSPLVVYTLILCLSLLFLICLLIIAINISQMLQQRLGNNKVESAKASNMSMSSSDSGMNVDTPGTIPTCVIRRGTQDDVLSLSKSSDYEDEKGEKREVLLNSQVQAGNPRQDNHDQTRNTKEKAQPIDILPFRQAGEVFTPPTGMEAVQERIWQEGDHGDEVHDPKVKTQNSSVKEYFIHN